MREEFDTSILCISIDNNWKYDDEKTRCLNPEYMFESVIWRSRFKHQQFVIVICYFIFPSFRLGKLDCVSIDSLDSREIADLQSSRIYGPQNSPTTLLDKLDFIWIKIVLQPRGITNNIHLCLPRLY